MVEPLPDPLEDRVMKEVLPPPHMALPHSKLFPKKGIPDWKVLRDHLTREGLITKTDLLELINLFKSVIKSEPNLIKIDDEYKNWIADISLRFRQCQIKASIKINSEMTKFYWTLGRDMDERKSSYAWGSHFYSQISKDLVEELPGVGSFSPRNLLYMHQFYRMFPSVGIAKQDVAQIEKISFNSIMFI